MRLSELHIENFRAIESLHLTQLKDLIVIAGPNGCGKTCVFDAIRLIKSAYGGYQFNEVMQWFGEFQINPADPSTFRTIFRDPAKPVSIRATLELSAEEREYLQSNAEAVLGPLIWAEITNQPPENYAFSPIAYAGQFPHLIAPVAQLTAQRATDVRTELAQPSFPLSLVIPPGAGGLQAPTVSLVARAMFQTFLPDELGIFDFHSAARAYAREALGGVNLDVRALDAQRRTQSLYNYQGKYSNVKSELVSTYLRDIIAKQSGVDLGEAEDLNTTMKELFQTFFPEKRYMGVQPGANGTVSFPVELPGGERHDLNDLSSGEKEVVYGYLRLRNATPHHSTILIDEPELHLNPGLLRGFPDFYYRRVARAYDNQVWLVTHSDALLRQAVGNINYSVFHMTPASATGASENQAHAVGEDELQRAILDLVGDVAAYRPYAKVLIFEGDTAKEFDVGVVSRLFPNLADRVNLVSGTSKGRVEELYNVLAGTAKQVGLADRFYAVTDRDFDVPIDRTGSTHVLSWNVYHIENYLLEPEYMATAIRRVAPNHPLQGADAITTAMETIATGQIDRLVLQHLRSTVNDMIVGSVTIGGNPAAEPVKAIMPSIEASLDRVDLVGAAVGDAAWLQERADARRAELQETLDAGTWLAQFPGRLILKSFVQDHLHGEVTYDGFVNLVLDAMVEAEHKPEGIAAVLSEVVQDP